MGARRLLLLLVAALAALVLPAGAASAEDGTIAHVESTGDGLRVLVNVPAGAEVDLAGVEATLDGDALDASAEVAGTGTEVKRTAVLAIDTSQSMRQRGRFTAAKEAARTYLDTVPADVAVGIVTFDATVAVALEPTTDRSAARDVVDGLELARDTLLYDGIVAAIEATGDEGQRSVLVLSDGADTGGESTLTDVTDRIASTRTLVDVVSLGQAGRALAPLQEMAEAGKGRVIRSTGRGLADDFRAEADVLASQVLVTAPLPEGFSATQATVEVVLPTAGEPVVARALAAVEPASSGEATRPDAVELDSPGGWQVPEWVLYAGTGVLAVGLIAAAMLLVPGKPAPMSIAERVEAYSTQVNRLEKAEKPASEPMLEQAKAAAAGVLERNSGLNDRRRQRLQAVRVAAGPHRGGLPRRPLRLPADRQRRRRSSGDGRRCLPAARLPPRPRQPAAPCL
ncbi:tight adherence protein B [Nocardioides sp. J9]|uniref:vWA domain-containing protein n=1 Tax=Nocardioides sp. J9 TaxID=935844 RepID=UPI0011A52ECD|nr:vWA domain-containing protein [Nocardioides sp. J9]TWH01367.1 tight adherence protein B [Nocardioides sp. J9]